jgi:hypothetical protein
MFTGSCAGRVEAGGTVACRPGGIFIYGARDPLCAGGLRVLSERGRSVLAEGKPADAITDVARALQEALVILGCKGNALGPLAKSARSKGLLGPHDALMTDMVLNLGIS